MTKAEFKKKWENYWFYYKIHTIVAIVAIIVVAILVTQCATTVRPDMTVMMISKNIALDQEKTKKVEDMLSKYTSDTNNDGRKVVNLEVFTISSDGKDAQMSMAYQQKMMAEIAASDNTIFILDDNFYNTLNKDNEFFCNLSDISDKTGSTDRVKLKDISAFNIDDLQKSYGDLTISARKFNSVSPVKSDKATIKNQVNVLKELLDTYTKSK